MSPRRLRGHTATFSATDPCKRRSFWPCCTGATLRKRESLPTAVGNEFFRGHWPRLTCPARALAVAKQGSGEEEEAAEGATWALVAARLATEVLLPARRVPRRSQRYRSRRSLPRFEETELGADRTTQHLLTRALHL